MVSLRDLINIVESRSAPLYHGTSVSAALEILHGGVLHAGTSLSRSYDVAGHFADKTSLKLDDNRRGLSPLGKLEYTADLGTAAILIFDQTKLMHNVGLSPYNWYYHNDPEEEYQRGHEMEEVTKRDATPVDRYIIGILDATASMGGGVEKFLNLVLEQFPEYADTVAKFRKLKVAHHPLKRW